MSVDRKTSAVGGRCADVVFYLPTVTGLLVGSAAGGAESQVLLVAKALAKADVRVSVIAFASAGLDEYVDGVRIVQRPPTKAHRRGVGKFLEAAAMHQAFVAAGAPVVVGRVAGPEVAVAALVAWLTGRRFVYSSASLLDFACIPALLRRRDAFLYRFGLRLAHAIIVQTSEQAESCLAEIGRQASVVPSIAESAPRRAVVPDSFVWAGRLEPNKRPLEYVRLARAVPDARFLMVAVPAVGQEELYAEVHAAAGAVPNLELLPPRPRAELAELIDRAVAVVSTSEYEGLPNVFLEAWARGVPALSLSHDPDGVIARHGLGVCAGGAPSEFAIHAKRLWDDRGRDDLLGERCRTFVTREHGADAVAAEWKRVLQLNDRRVQTAGDGRALAC